MTWSKIYGKPNERVLRLTIPCQVPLQRINTQVLMHSIRIGFMRKGAVTKEKLCDGPRLHAAPPHMLSVEGVLTTLIQPGAESPVGVFSAVVSVS